MMPVLQLFVVLIGTMTITSYRSVPAQTKPTNCFITSIGERVNNHGVAISQDMLCPLIAKAAANKHLSYDKIMVIRKHSAANCKYKNHIHYGDQVYIEKYGFKTVNDCMGLTKLNKDHTKHFREPIHRALDIWVETFAEEKAVQQRTLKVYLVRDQETGTVEGPVPPVVQPKEKEPKSALFNWAHLFGNDESL